MGNNFDNMSVPHSRQQPWLAGWARRDLHHEQTVFEVDLLGQKDACEAASSQLAAKEIRANLISGIRQILIAGARLAQPAQERRRAGLVQTQQPLERLRIARKAGNVLG